MAFHRKWFAKTVQSDEGYEVAFARKEGRGQKVKYSDGYRSLTVIGEPIVTVADGKRKLGYHFALQDRYLADWDDASKTTAEERNMVRERLRSSLEFMRVPSTFDFR